MATFDDVARLALALPETSEKLSRGSRHWSVRDKLFVWERKLLKPDLAALGDAAPEGPLLGVRTDDVSAKEAMLANDPKVFLTIPHFDGYPAVLARLDGMKLPMLKAVIVEAWLARAPPALAKAFREGGKRK